MTRRSLVTLALMLGLFAVPRAAEARFRLDDATRDAIRQILTDLRAQTSPLRDQIRAASTTFFDGVKAELALNDDQARLVRWQLKAATWKAVRAFRELPDADQTAANLSTALQTEYNAVFATLTNDAGQLANLAALAQTYADAIAPLKLQIWDLVAAARAQIQALLAA